MLVFNSLIQSCLDKWVVNQTRIKCFVGKSIISPSKSKDFIDKLINNMLCLSVSRLWVGPGAVSSCLSGFYRLSVCCALQLCQSSESCPAPVRHQPRYRYRPAGPVHVWLDFSQPLRSRNHAPPIRSEESGISVSFYVRHFNGIHMWFNTPSLTFSHIAASSWFSFGNCSGKQGGKQLSNFSYNRNNRLFSAFWVKFTLNCMERELQKVECVCRKRDLHQHSWSIINDVFQSVVHHKSCKCFSKSHQN